MTADVSELSEIERDAISEIANIGVSRAAASLRQMVGEQVLLSVPAVNIVSRSEAAEPGRRRQFAEARCRSASIRGTIFRARAS